MLSGSWVTRRVSAALLPSFMFQNFDRVIFRAGRVPSLIQRLRGPLSRLAFVGETGHHQGRDETVCVGVSLRFIAEARTEISR
eukprot:1423555-Pyramimonas_sp.AAC.1